MSNTIAEHSVKTDFFARLPQTIDGSELWKAIERRYDDDEAAVVADEIVRTLTADCTTDEFHNWNYDHLEFIIELSNEQDFPIPRNLLNGLPEQLILLVDHAHLTDPECYG